MSYISTIPREQLMLPSSIDDYVSSDNIVRFIDLFVEKELKIHPELFLQKKYCSEGRPSYPPGCLYKLLLYGYLNSVSSSRKLEQETFRNLEMMWLINNLHPDHWTISNFRKEHKEGIRRITIDFRRFLKDSGFLSGKNVSTDGSKIKAYACREVLSLKLIDKKLTQAEKEIDRWLKQLESNDMLEDGQHEMLETSQELQAKIKAMQEEISKLESQRKELQALGVESLTPSDPEAKVMKTKDGFLPAYNVQTVVDNETHLILSCETTDYPNDYHCLEENLSAVENQLGIIPKTALADTGYANEDQVQSLEKKGIECIVPFPEETESKKRQRDAGITFTYHPEEDYYLCSQQKKVLLVEKRCKKRNKYYSSYQCKECGDCPQKELCTKSALGRYIYRRLDDQWLRSHKEKMEQPKYKKKFAARKCVAEHPFGTMKYYMGQIPILLRGKEKVQIEMDLYSTAYNLKRISNMFTVKRLIEQLEVWMANLVLYRTLSQFRFPQSLFCHYRRISGNTKFYHLQYTKEHSYLF